MEKIKICDCVVGIALTNDIGKFTVGAFEVEVDGRIRELYTLMYGDVKNVVNVRINSACFTSGPVSRFSAK